MNLIEWNSPIVPDLDGLHLNPAAMIELDPETRCVRAWLHGDPTGEVFEAVAMDWVGRLGEFGPLYRVDIYQLCERLLAMRDRGEDPVVALDDAGPRL